MGPFLVKNVPNITDVDIFSHDTGNEQAFKFPKHENNLIKDPKHYFSKLKNNPVGYGIGTVNIGINGTQPNTSVEILSPQFQTLQGKEWILGEVIDGFWAIRGREWNNTVVVSVQHTACILGDQFFWPQNRNWHMYKFAETGFTRGKILMPYTSRNHWCLLIVNANDKTVIHLDPLHSETPSDKRVRSKTAFTLFIKFLNDAAKYFPDANKDIDKWKHRINKTPRPMQPRGDSWNCGVYTMLYCDFIGGGGNFRNDFCPDRYRMKIAKIILENMDDVSENCQFCFLDKENPQRAICKTCGRYSHLVCLRNSWFYVNDVCTLCRMYVTGRENE